MAEQDRAEAKQKSDLSRAFSEDGARKTHVGGQALIEGVMMRGKLNWAAAVREPSGNIYVEEHDLASGKDKNKWLHVPLVRGCTALVESLMLGFKALEIAAMHAFDDEDDEEEGRGQGAPVASAGLSGGEPSAFAGFAPAASTGPSAVEPPASTNSVPIAANYARSSSSAEPPASESFSWKDDFGRPGTVIDALGAQRTLEVVVDSDEGEVTPGSDAPGGFDAAAAASACPEAGEGGASEAKPKESEGIGKWEMTISMVLGLVLGVVLFIVAPALLTNLIVGEYDGNTLLWNVVDGVLRVAVFVFYIWLIGRMEDIRRMFMYHGAEHKTIHCYEHGLPLTPDNARRFPRLHVRCGTAFLIMVMIIAILVYTVVPLNALISAWGVPDGVPKLLLVIVSRIVLMPVIAGISYEITVKWAGAHPDNPLVKVILWPGMQMQYLTTNEPDDGQLECAIAAMERVLAREEAEAAKTAPTPAV